MQSVNSKIISRIYGHGRGWCFSQIDFSDIAVRSTVDTILGRAEADGTIRRVLRGLFDYPLYSDLLKTYLSPDMGEVASALARKYGWKLVPEGSTALHILGLDTQVPARFQYYSNGPDRSYVIGERSLEFFHQKTKHTMIKDHFAATVVQALLSLGPNEITDKHRKQIASIKNRREFNRVIRETKQVTAWVHDEILRIADLTEDSA